MLLICACVLDWDLGSGILGVSSSMGETVLLCSLSEPLTTAAPLVGLEPCILACQLVLPFFWSCPGNCIAEIHGHVFPVMPGGHYSFSTGILASGFYNLPTPFHDVSWAFSVGIALLKHAFVWGTPQSLILSVVSRGGFFIMISAAKRNSLDEG